MLPEYLKYWGLKKTPFSLTPDPEMLYMSKQHQEGLVRLKYAVISNKGGALLVSENAGDGKTTMLHKLKKDLNAQFQGFCNSVFIDHPTLTTNQMVGEIARQLGVAGNTTDKLQLLNQLREFLLACHERGEKNVVILDEGQMLCHRPDILQELRILLNFCVSDAFLLTFILSGQKPLDEAVRAMPEFYQRLPVRFFLRNLDRQDTRELIRHRLKKAGCPADREIFSEDGYNGIYNYSKGCPRIICSVADLSLVIAHSRYSEQVDFVSVSQATSDMNRTDGGYHYYYFLKSFGSEEVAQNETPRDNAVEREIRVELEKVRQQDTETDTPVVEPAAVESELPEQTQFLPEEPSVAGRIIEPEMQEKLEQEETYTNKFMIEDDESADEEPLEKPIDSPEAKNTEKPVEEESENGDKCPFCGLIVDAQLISECPNCGEKLTEPEEQEPAPEPEPVVEAAEQPELQPEEEEISGSEPIADSEPEPESDEGVPISAAGEEPVRSETEIEKEIIAQSAEMLFRGKLAEIQLGRRFKKKYVPSPGERVNGSEALLKFPLTRFGSSAVVSVEGDTVNDSFTSRCGMLLASDYLLLDLKDRRYKILPGNVRRCDTESISKDGHEILTRLVVTTEREKFFLVLPLPQKPGSEVARAISSYMNILSAADI